MKAKVLVRFRDKHNGTIHNPDEVITITKKRFNEILSVGHFVEEVKEDAEENTQAE